MKIRKHYDDLKEKGLTFKKPSMTQQHFKDDCDINVIVRRFNAGQINTMPLAMNEGFYADVSDLGSYQDANARVNSIKDYFANLPSSVREKFNNSVDDFVAFASSDNSRDAFIEMGILEKPEPVKPVQPAPVEPVKPVQPAPAGTDA